MATPPYRLRIQTGMSQEIHYPKDMPEAIAQATAIFRANMNEPALFIRLINVEKQQIIFSLALENDNGTEAAGRFCRVCGCSDHDPCEGGCSWIGPQRCSACVEDDIN